MRLDEGIKMFEWTAERDRPFEYLYKWAAGSLPCNEKKALLQFAKWLKELKKLRKQVKHCKAVHGAFFNELAEQGIIT